MKYFKNIEDNYITSISTGNAGHTEITKEEYYNILSVIHSRPIAEDGYTYKLHTDLTWELTESLPVEDDTEATITDYQEALGEFGVTTV